ncbi:hypothetical protein F4801DRAFT_413153 [Xylaria longipes]|nr:hypothetical protein F4801DRAFT_413153 [Xylaria longipes]RYC59211.1 hypothetical protein CHU98_g7011 [Xylaria longipes]
MKSTLAVSLSILGLASAHPARRDDPVRILPKDWTFEITSLEGPGCPDFGVPDGEGNLRSTRLTYGQNTMDGSEIYHRFIAYPSLHVELGKTESVWCETELQYKEFKDGEESEDYRLRLHKNGTKAIATYDIGSDVEATLSFTYLDADITDSYTLRGPTDSGEYSELTLTNAKSGLYEEPKCGATKLKFRVELEIGGTGEKGVVESGHSTNEDGSTQYYGTQLGFSYDWEKCEN